MDFLCSLMHLLDLMSQISSSSSSSPPSSFPHMLSELNHPFLLRVISCGLLSINRSEVAPHLPEMIAIASKYATAAGQRTDQNGDENDDNKQEMPDTDTDTTTAVSLTSLPTDLISKSLTFLPLPDLFPVEQCSRYLCVVARLPSSVEVITKKDELFDRFWMTMAMQSQSDSVTEHQYHHHHYDSNGSNYPTQNHPSPSQQQFVSIASVTSTRWIWR